MTQNTKFAATAHNLRDLRNRIEEAIAMVGEDAEWIGLEDGHIYMWADDNGPILCIETTPTRPLPKAFAGRGEWQHQHRT
jgi:hypothetical protein